MMMIDDDNDAGQTPCHARQCSSKNKCAAIVENEGGKR